MDFEFNNSGVDIWTKDHLSLNDALSRTTHLAIGAHQDDLEIMAYEGISTCFESSECWFSGVVVTDGRGSSRTGPYENFDDESMRLVRRDEQRKAAQLGQYSAQLQLDYRSSDIKGGGLGVESLRKDLVSILLKTRPETIYLHQPADKHDTHVAVFYRCIEALRFIADVYIPDRILGCEVWRGLDWLDDSEKVAMDCHLYPRLAREILLVFDSQINGGKAYDSATLGRRCANATYFDAGNPDFMNMISWALDLKPLIMNQDLSITEFIHEKINLFATDVQHRISCNR